ncbi:unnamed protein product [Diatraea saccharalis]|uniref:DUF3456 domain-containing protein n=1 Tax=Diatraea saccharalis TaxID=40085 RepID=A0A9N9RDI2_9NEOP|nr:unnamed protein product [Diatraea saccharalis]
MKCAFYYIAIVVSFSVVSARIDPKNLKCLVCRQIFEELNVVIKSTDKWKKVDVGNFRMDASGNTMQDKVPAHRSAVYISEVIDEICECLNIFIMSISVTYYSPVHLQGRQRTEFRFLNIHNSSMYVN